MGKKHRYKARQEHHPENAEPPSEYPHGEDGMVYTVKIEPHPDDVKKYAEEKDYRKDQIDAARRLNTISVWGVGVACTALVALIVSACIVHQQLRAAWKANEISKKASDLAYRPYIGINGIAVKYAWYDSSRNFHLSDIRTKEANMLNFRVEIKNLGPVPGSNYTSKWRVFLGGVELQAEKKVPNRPFTFFPSQIAFLSGSVGIRDYPDVIAEKKLLMVEVTVEYDGPTGHYSECEKEQYAPEYNGFFNLGPCAPQ